MFLFQVCITRAPGEQVSGALTMLELSTESLLVR